MAPSQPTILQRSAAPEASEPVARRTDRGAGVAGWKAVGWFGALLALLGLLDALLYFVPTAFGSPEWEFGTIAAAITSLPLATVGLAAVVGALTVAGWGWQRLLAAGLLLLLALFVAAALLLFALTVPLALRAASGPQGPAVYRAIIRTAAMGVGFGGAYVVGAIHLMRLDRKERKNG